MRVLIISDTHGDTDNFDLLISREASFDLIIHCGDGARDVDYIEERSKCNVREVRGNCDLLTKAPNSFTDEIDGHKIYVEHGVHISNLTAERMVEFAHFNNVEVVMYGHTHCQRIENKDGIWIINPGSLSKPRDGYPSYIILETNGDGKLKFEGKRLY